MKRFFTRLSICLLFTLVMSQAKAQATHASSTSSKESTGIPENNFGIVIQILQVSKSGNSIKLNWHTSAEKNSNYFEIQRSTDGINFTVIALMFALEDAENGGSYRYYDFGISNLKADNLYYRLKMVDRKGNTKLVSFQKIEISETEARN